MRTLCLKFQRELSPSWAEVFLQLSPRVLWREPRYVFVDIESTSKLLRGDHAVLQKALSLASSFDEDVQGAISDTPYGAQLLTHARPHFISKPQRESFDLENVLIEYLAFFEGLNPWESPSQVDSMLKSFRQLGLKYLKQLQSLPLESLRQRWGDDGHRLWRRLQQKDPQAVSPLNSREPLSAYAYFDEPVGFTNPLFLSLQQKIEFLFLRLQGLGRFACKIQVQLYCEYSSSTHQFEVQAASPNRDLKLFLDLLNLKLQTINLENPVREYDIEVFDAEENIVQFDFFSPPDPTGDQLERLKSLFLSQGISAGFWHTQAHLLPEEAFSLNWRPPPSPEAQGLPRTAQQVSLLPSLLETAQDGSFSLKTAFSETLFLAPRPSLLLQAPQIISRSRLREFNFLSRYPTERIENQWWGEFQNRDYYVAQNSQGAIAWIFKDLCSQKYYLHGWFD